MNALLLCLRSPAAGVLLVLSISCTPRPQPPLPPPPPPTITSFTVTPSSLPGPGDVVLEWGTTNATAIFIEQVGRGPVEVGTDLSGRRTLRVDDDAVFLITAQGAGGSDLRAASVAMANRATSVLFSAIPATVEAGGTATLVWNAPGARTVRLEEVQGPRLELNGQLESGSLRVTPKRTTTYRLTADDVSATTTVSVAPTITLLEAGSTLPAPGEPVTIRWETSSATAITLRRLGLPTPLPVAAGQVESGSYTDIVPEGLPPDAVLTYVLEATNGSLTTSRALEVFVGGGVRINSFTAPSYALFGTTFPVSWTTAGAQSAELIVDGQRVFLARSAAEVASGTYPLPAPTQSTRVEFVARNARGAEARVARTIEGVGALSPNFFVADKTVVTAPGEAVTLSWSMTNARTVRIFNNSVSGFYREFTGAVDTGTLVVRPNRFGTLTRVTYRLEADNGTGAAPVVRTVDIDLDPAAQVSFVFPRPLPVGAPMVVTGTTLASTGQLLGFKNVEKNPPGEAFIDIRGTGTPVTFGAGEGAANVALPAAFEATLFGTRFSRTRLNISRFGWFSLPTVTTPIAGPPENTVRFENALEPLTVAPYWRNLTTSSNQVHWRLDSVPNARRLIVQWSNVRPVNGPVDARLTFQAQLYSTGKVVLAYRDVFKVQGSGTIGVVNNSETDEVGPSMPIAAGDVYRLFGPQAPPVNLRAEATPYAGQALIGSDVIELEGQANIPPNLVSITEISTNPPPGVSNGQWLEISNNRTDAGFDLSGWELDFGTAATFQFPMGTTVPPGGILLVGQARDLGDPGPPGGITIDDGGVVARPQAAVEFPPTLIAPTSGGFARIGIGGTEYTRFTYPQQLVGTSYGLEAFRAPWLISSTQTRIICDSVRWSYGTNGQIGSPGLANGPCWPYQRHEVIPGNFQPLASNPAATRINFSTTTPDVSTTVVDFTLPGRTPIRAFGLSTPFNTVVAHSDGYLVLAGAASGFNNALLPSTSNNLWVAPFWDDLQGRPSSGLYLLQTGTPPNVTTIISWEDWTFWLHTSYVGTSINFQVHFLPGGDIEFHYGPMVAGSGANAAALVQGSSASVWIEAVTAADAYAARNSDAVIPTVNPIFEGLGIRFRSLRR